MKKSLFCTGLALSLGITSLAIPTSSYAQTQENSPTQINSSKTKVKEIKKYDEITDLNILFEQAKNNKQEFKNSNKFRSEATVTPTQKEFYITEDTPLAAEDFQTSQLLEETTNTDGSKSAKYVITNFAIVQEASTIALALADRYREKWDSTYGVKAYSRIYVNETYDAAGRGWIALSKVNGGWQVTDNNYTLPSKRVRLNQSGVGVNGAVMKQQDYYPGGNTIN